MAKKARDKKLVLEFFLVLVVITKKYLRDQGCVGKEAMSYQLCQ